MICHTTDMVTDKTSYVVTPDELANSLKVSSKTVMRLLRNGHIKGVKIGGQWRIPIEEVERLVTWGSAKSALTTTPSPAPQAVKATRRRRVDAK